MKAIALSLLLGLSVVLSTCAGHGYIFGSRAFLCHLNNGALNKDCGQVQYEPQSVEGPKNFPHQGPEDGHIASANIALSAKLDEYGADRWTPMPISKYVASTNGAMWSLFFQWKLTAQHMTTSFEYFISKPTYNPSAPLTRDQLNLVPICARSEMMGTIPPADYKTSDCTFDSTGYAGQHVILGVWTINDTDRSFYQVIDVMFTQEKPKPEVETEAVSGCDPSPPSWAL